MTDPLNFHDRARDAKRREREHLQRYLPIRPQRERDAEARRKYCKRWVALGMPTTPHSTHDCPRCHTKFPVYIHQAPTHCEKCRRELAGKGPLVLEEVDDE